MIHVMCCPGRVPVVKGGVQVWDTDPPSGHLPAYIRCFEVALRDNRTGPITIIEDDTEIPEGFAAYVMHWYEWIERRNEIVQWWCNNKQWTPPLTHYLGAPFFVHRSGGRFLSTQAVTYARPVALEIVAHLKSILPTASADDFGRKHSGDEHIRQWLGDKLIGQHMHATRRDFLVHWPPILQHVGEQSLVAPGIPLNDGFRQNEYYSRNNADLIVRLRPEPMIYYPQNEPA